MKLRVILFTLTICALAVSLPGCDAPAETETEADITLKFNKLSAAHADLQNQHNVLLLNHENLKGVREELNALTSGYEELTRLHNALQIKNTILETQFQATNDRYEEIITGLASDRAKYEEALERQIVQYQELVDRQALIIKQLALVNSGKARVITDNLTDAEYKAFLKGWNLWWDSFN